MARRIGTKNELIECEYCGEMYSVTYKRCPFCNGDGTGRWDDPDTEIEEYDDRHRGGKRLASGQGAGYGGGPPIGRIIGTVISLILIIAAICIVISIVRSIGGKGEDPDAGESPGTESVLPSTEPAESVPAETEPTDTQAPAPTSTTPSVDLVIPTGFTLNREDFTFDAVGQVFQMQVTYTPANAHGEVTWKSSNPNVASVSWNGVVTAVSQGTATLTAAVEGVGEKTCIVRCNFKSSTTAKPDPSTTSTSVPAASGLSLNREDFTLSRQGETFRMTVSGTSSAVTWASSNTGVAAVGADGTVTAVGHGTCDIIATVDGVTLKCIVRCGF